MTFSLPEDGKVMKTQFSAPEAGKVKKIRIFSPGEIPRIFPPGEIRISVRGGSPGPGTDSGFRDGFPDSKKNTKRVIFDLFQPVRKVLHAFLQPVRKVRSLHEKCAFSHFRQPVRKVRRIIYLLKYPQQFSPAGTVF